MSLLSNTISGILTSQIGRFNENATDIFNLNDKSFAEILEKQLVNQPAEKLGFFPAGMGMPFGLDIQDISSSIKIKDNMNIHPTEDIYKQTDFENFARKHATEFYGKCAGNVVINLSEFVNDTIKID